MRSASEIFGFWCEARKADYRSGEHTEILNKVLDFINAHGTARFSALHPRDSEPIVRDRAGWWHDIEEQNDDTTRAYIFTSGALREATKGYEFSRVTKALDVAGALAKKGSKAASVPTDIPEGRKVRLYWINPEKLEAAA
jgi:putative DNA primase/helicase